MTMSLRCRPICLSVTSRSVRSKAALTLDIFHESTNILPLMVRQQARFRLTRSTKTFIAEHGQCEINVRLHGERIQSHGAQQGVASGLKPIRFAILHAETQIVDSAFTAKRSRISVLFKH